MSIIILTQYNQSKKIKPENIRTNKGYIVHTFHLGFQITKPRHDKIHPSSIHAKQYSHQIKTQINESNSIINSPKFQYFQLNIKQISADQSFYKFYLPGLPQRKVQQCSPLLFSLLSSSRLPS